MAQRTKEMGARMELSIVIPAYNEARRLRRTLDSLAEYLDRSPHMAEVIVVDDGSTDGTKEVACWPGSRRVPFRLICRPVNDGKGAAVRDGMRAARGDYVLFMDADLSTPIDELDRLLAIARHGSPIVIGSRYLRAGSVRRRQPLYRIVISRLGNRIIQRAVLPGIKDTQCGFKLFERSAGMSIALMLTRDGFSFDIELLVIARRLGLAIREEPVSWYHHPGTRLRVPSATVTLLRDLRWLRRTYGHPAKPVGVPSYVSNSPDSVAIATAAPITSSALVPASKRGSTPRVAGGT